ncbi:hypothetical protein FOL47_004911 [Perkinsus chesapeaki]|uniref:Uncharacterized protein n=1 Tax=Perkinsus chesapeaki TaxID=330153 RepID=A0A7J6M0A7_PERCH|nr:hypothetical protein FOL47_004911 [Perkinsus chesapeaki]
MHLKDCPMHVVMGRFTQIVPKQEQTRTLPIDIAKAQAKLYVEDLGRRVSDALAIAVTAVEECLGRAEYEALKIVAWSERRGSHIVGYMPSQHRDSSSSSTAASTGDGLDSEPSMSDVEVFRAVTKESRHVIYVSDQEVIGYDATKKCRIVLTWLQFLLVCPTFRVLSRPRPDNVHSVVDRARLVNSPDNSIDGGFDTDLHWAYYCENGKPMSTTAFLQVLKDIALTLSASTKVLSWLGGAIGAGVGACSVTVPYYFLGFIPWGTTTTTVAASWGTTIAAMGWYASWVGFGVGVVAAPAVWLLMQQYRKREHGCLPFMIINDTDLDVTCYTYYASDTVQFISLSSDECAQWSMLELSCKEHADLKAFRLGVTRAGT